MSTSAERMPFTGDAGVNSGPDPAAVEQRARNMGWRPKDEFKGDPARWTDATEFVRRGEDMIPYVKAENRSLKSQLEQQQQQIDNLQRTLKTNTEMLSKVETTVAATATSSLEAQRADLAERLRAARTDNDIAQELTIQDELYDVQQQIREAKAAARKPPAAAQPEGGGGQSGGTAGPPQQLVAALREFESRTPWIDPKSSDYDPVMTAAANAIMASERSAGALQGMDFAETFDHIARKTIERFGKAAGGRRQNPNRVESGGRTSGGGGGGGNSDRASYQDMPDDARAACDKYENRLVGEGKRFKDREAYRKDYAETFFRMT